MADYIIDILNIDNLDEMMVIENQVELSPWSKESFSYELHFNKSAHYIGIFDNQGMAGFAGVWIFTTEAHITTVSIEKSRRGKGLGTVLLWHLIDYCKRKGCHWITLEVWDENASAISLYNKFGFVPMGIRPNYYDHKYNAFIMWAGCLSNMTMNRRMKNINTWADNINDNTTGGLQVETRK